MRKFAGLWTLAALVLGLHAEAQTITSPWGRKLSVDGVNDLLKTHPMKLIEKLNSLGLKVYLLPGKVAKTQENLMLQGLPVMSIVQLRKFDLEEHMKGSEVLGEALFIPKVDPCCDLGEDFMLVSPAADALTVIHEAMHFLFTKQLSAKELDTRKNAEANIQNAMRTFEFRFNKVYRNWSYLDESAWRRDMVNTALDELEALNTSINATMSEEIFIERTLQAKVDSTSLYYNAVRLHLGENYLAAKLKYMATKTADVQFLSQWMQGELKLRTEEIEIRERFDLEKQFTTVDGRVALLFQRIDDLRNFKLSAPQASKK